MADNDGGTLGALTKRLLPALQLGLAYLEGKRVGLFNDERRYNGFLDDRFEQQEHNNNY